MMNLRTVTMIGLFLLFFSIEAEAQLRSRTTERSEPPPVSEAVRSTPAFAEIVLRRTEIESRIEELLVTYKEKFPKVKDARYELGLIEAEVARFAGFDKSVAPKLTLALGKLLVRRARYAAEYWSVKNRYNDEHPAAKKARRKFEIFDSAVKEII